MPSAVPLSLRTNSYVKGTIFGTSLCYYKPQKEKTAFQGKYGSRFMIND